MKIVISVIAILLAMLPMGCIDAANTVKDTTATIQERPALLQNIEKNIPILEEEIRLVNIAIEENDKDKIYIHGKNMNNLSRFLIEEQISRLEDSNSNLLYFYEQYLLNVFHGGKSYMRYAEGEDFLNSAELSMEDRLEDLQDIERVKYEIFPGSVSVEDLVAELEDIEGVDHVYVS